MTQHFRDDRGIFGFCDAAKRISDIINQHIVDGHRGMWSAHRLSDGTSDGMAYQLRSEAVAAQRPNERWYGFFKIPWDGCTPRGAEAFLRLNRQMAEDPMFNDIGGQLVDPEMADQEYMVDTRRETAGGDRRKIFRESRWPINETPYRSRRSGLIVP